MRNLPKIENVLPWIWGLHENKKVSMQQSFLIVLSIIHDRLNFLKSLFPIIKSQYIKWNYITILFDSIRLSFRIFVCVYWIIAIFPIERPIHFKHNKTNLLQLDLRAPFNFLMALYSHSNAWFFFKLSPKSVLIFLGVYEIWEE